MRWRGTLLCPPSWTALACALVVAAGTAGCASGPCNDDQVERAGTCRPACNSDLDCTHGARCSDGACLPGSPGNGAGDVSGSSGGGASHSSASLSMSVAWGTAASNGATSSPPGSPSSLSAGPSAASATSSMASSSSEPAVFASSSMGAATSVACGVGAPGSPCGGNADCGCDLACYLGVCTAACTTPGTVGSCAAGTGCTGVGLNLSVCQPTVARGEACSPSVCEAGLSCDTVDIDAQGNPLPGAQACHQACEYGVSACGGAESCLPSTRGGNEVQLNGGVEVTCNPALGSQECDQVHSYGCHTYGVRSLCTRPVAACGTAVGLANTMPNPDGTPRDIPFTDVCNLGPATTLQGNPVAADRFCQDFPNLASPPQVSCRHLVTGAPVGLGLCVAVCRHPPLGSQPEAVTDCPAGYTCDTPNSHILNMVAVNGSAVSCASDNDCAAFPEAVCMAGPSGAPFCIQRLGTCQPL